MMKKSYAVQKKSNARKTQSILDDQNYSVIHAVLTESNAERASL